MKLHKHQMILCFKNLPTKSSYPNKASNCHFTGIAETFETWPRWDGEMGSFPSFKKQLEQLSGILQDTLLSAKGKENMMYIFNIFQWKKTNIYTPTTCSLFISQLKSLIFQSFFYHPFVHISSTSNCVFQIFQTLTLKLWAARCFTSKRSKSNSVLSTVTYVPTAGTWLGEVSVTVPWSNLGGSNMLIHEKQRWNCTA